MNKQKQQTFGREEPSGEAVLDRPSRSSAQQIAIVGMAFRFPGDVSDEAGLWETLEQKRDLVTQIPADRWAVDELQHPTRAEPGRSITFSAGVLSRIDEFDAGFFGISPREATWIDPQQRLLLELSWEAMENAGVPPSSMAGSDCAVYVGIASVDYGSRTIDDLASISSHSMTGNTLSIAANRLSYVFDLHGPSLPVDTACSSSLAALHQACNTLRAGEASAALVAGVNVLLHPYPFIGFTKASMLSADGRCKVFDASGDGYVRAEGGAVLLLKPLDAALADGDEIHAVILASGVNADGARKTGITIPSSEGQAELMRDVLARSGIGADEVDFIEAHGTGTAVGDPIETAAIGAVYGQGRATPLPIGSVKANMGHLEAAAGMAGLVKAVLALKNRALPAALHLDTPNPYIDFEALNLELVTEYKTLEKADSKPLVAGVNSFGFGGANAHVLLQEFRAPDETKEGLIKPFDKLRANGKGPFVVSREPVERSNHEREPLNHNPHDLPALDALPPLLLSARTDEALKAMAGRYAELLDGRSAQGFYDIAHAAAFRRDRMEKRLALQADSVESATHLLRSYAEGDAPPEVFIEDSLPQEGSVAFIYSGNGAQWVGMGRALLDESPRFAEILADLDMAMRPDAGFALIEALAADEEHSRLDDTAVAQPLLFAIQVAVTLLMRESGIEPVAVAGHSVGEVAAAWASGALDLEQAIRVICVRSRAQHATRGEGRMAAMRMSPADAAELLAALDECDAEIAGINSPNNVTLSGSLEGLMRVQEAAEAQGIFFRLLDLDYAFHSNRMDPIETPLREQLADLFPLQTETTRFVSAVTGDVLDGRALDADYWWRNVREPVRFADAVAKLAELGCRVFVEIGPHAILQRYIGECLNAADIKARVLPTLRRTDDGARAITEAVLRAQLVVDRPALQTWFPHPARRVRLPNYPWQRERHWYPRTAEASLGIERRRVHPLLGWRLNGAEAAWENTLDPAVVPWLADHQVGGTVVYPGAAYAEMALAAAREWLGGERCIIEQLDIVAPMVFDGGQSRTLRFALDPRDGGFRIKSRRRLSSDEWTLHAVGRVLEPTERIPAARIDLPVAPTRPFEHEAHYRLAAMLGLDYGPAFRQLREGYVGADKLEARLGRIDGEHLEGYLLHPALLDACFQSLIGFFGDEIEMGHGIALLPVKIGRLDRCGEGQAVHLRAHLRRCGTRSVLADFELLDEDNRLVASISGCRFRAAPLKRQAQQKVSKWRIVPRLRPHPLDGLITEVPATSDLAAQAHSRLTDIQHSRQTWFHETLPLIEALTLSFVCEAFRQLARTQPSDWQQRVQASPLGRWAATLMTEEGLLREEEEGWVLAEESDLPASQDLWQTILRDAPASLPKLTLIGRVGRALPALLGGETDARELLEELRQSPFAEALYNDEPAYLGVRLALEALLRHLAESWPAARQLRVLEISAGASELPKTLIEALPEERFHYVLASTGEAARQVAEYQEHANVVVASFDPAGWKFETDKPVPDAFDVVILRHSLHRAAVPQGALAQTRSWLAAGGVLCVAERHADWSADLLDGVDPVWWREAEAPAGAPLSSLLPPAAWQQALNDAGFADCEQLFEPAAEGLAEGAYLLLAKRPAEAGDVPQQDASGSWLLLADDASASLTDRIAARLQAQGQQVTVADSAVEDQLANADHVVHLLGWHDAPDMAAVAVTRLTRHVQTLSARTEKAPRLWLVTRGAALATELPIGLEPSPAQSALWGFGRVVMNEFPQLNCTLIDLACDPDAGATPARLEQEFLHPDGACGIVLARDARYCLVMREDSAPSTRQAEADTRFRLDFHMPGQLRNLVWLPEAERALRDDEVEVRTHATGLNFRDVMYVMGLLPDEAVEKGFAGASLGLEFSGVVTRVGARVQDLLPGDAVVGFGSSCFASHVVTRADAVAPMPESWGYEAAATVPTVFFTAYYALKRLADLQPGERVLIHGAAGGVGIAAIQLARHLGAEIFATAGSDEKREFVALLGANHVFDSRSLTFADDVLVATNGEGVDVVLNSLAGEAMRRSLDVLKPFGRFLELGKRDFYENTPIGMRPFKDNISYFGIDADQLLTGRPKLAARLFREVMALFRAEILTPLPYRTFSADRIVEAFRVMQQARHIGKIVVSLADARPAVEAPPQPPAETRFAKESTWLVTGGLSGFGLASAQWLAARGVGNLVLVGRRGMDTPDAPAIVERFAEQGVNVLAQACDITDANAVATLVERIEKTLPPLKGVLHAAASYDDRLIANLDEQSIESVMNAKLLGAWHLHQATLEVPLEHFVLYSSVTTAIGNPGQGNYVAANAALEGLVAMRRHMGLPATCVAWGPVGDTGYLARNDTVRESLEHRLGKPPLAAAEALAQLDHAFADESGFAMPANFDWNVLARILPSASSSRFELLNRNRADKQATDMLDLRALIADKTPEEVTGIVKELVVGAVAEILCIAPDRIAHDRALHDQGMDSLMAVELALGLEERLGIQLPVMMLNDAPTVNKVAARIVEKLYGGGLETAQETDAAALITNMARQHGEGVTEEEMKILSEDARKLSQTGTRLVA